MTHNVHLLQSNPASLSLWLQRCESLHRSLRPNLPADYEGYLHLMFLEGARMVLLHEGNIPKAIALFRIQHTTFCGLRLYVDDLVTVEDERGKGYGAALIDWCEELAQEQGCQTFALDSGVQRSAAHRFYFRHGFAIGSFGFTKSLA